MLEDDDGDGNGDSLVVTASPAIVASVDDATCLLIIRPPFFGSNRGKLKISLATIIIICVRLSADDDAAVGSKLSESVSFS